MIAGIMTLLGFIPGVLNFFTNLQKNYYDAKVRVFMARTNATRDVAEAAITADSVKDTNRVSALRVFASNKVLVLLLVGFSLPIMLFMWQGIVWDKMVCPHWYDAAELAKHVCTTDAIKGQLADWANTIIWCLFGSGTSLAALKMWYARHKGE